MKYTYTDKEIELIKKKAYNIGKIEGCIFTLIVCDILLLLFISQ